VTENNQESSKTLWHQLLGKLLKDLLSPVGILVYPNLPVMSESPKADILLLRRETAQWTAEQLSFLPDGIRNSRANHILLEFKYTESFNAKAVQQALGYDFFYKQHNLLSGTEVQSFLLSAKKPRTETLEKLGYENTELQGVYRSRYEVLNQIVLLSLNELSNQPQNAFIKCFASRLQEKRRAFNTVKRYRWQSMTTQLKWFIAGLWDFWFALKGDDLMNVELTPEEITEMGKMWGQVYLSGLTIEEVLNHFETEKIMSQFKVEDRLVGLNPEDRLAGLNPEDRLAGLNPEDRLAGLNPIEIEAYLKKLKQKPD